MVRWGQADSLLICLQCTFKILESACPIRIFWWVQLQGHSGLPASDIDFCIMLQDFGVGLPDQDDQVELDTLLCDLRIVQLQGPLGFPASDIDLQVILQDLLIDVLDQDAQVGSSPLPPYVPAVQLQGPSSLPACDIDILMMLQNFGVDLPDQDDQVQSDPPVMAGGAEGLGGGGAGGPSAKGLSSLAQSSRASRGPMMRSDPRPPPRPTQEDIDAQAEIDYQNDMANAEEDENLDHGAIEDYDSAESHNYN
ncbi:hypothetical protein GGX14DRAFT_409157, partial [Mycena pura]